MLVLCSFLSTFHFSSSGEFLPKKRTLCAVYFLCFTFRDLLFFPFSLSLSCSITSLLSAPLNGGRLIMPALQGCCWQLLWHRLQWVTGNFEAFLHTALNSWQGRCYWKGHILLKINIVAEPFVDELTHCNNSFVSWVKSDVNFLSNKWWSCIASFYTFLLCGKQKNF